MKAVAVLQKMLYTIDTTGRGVLLQRLVSPLLSGMERRGKR